jgi:hypothetical protein
LLSAHRKDPVKGKSILLWPGTELSGFHLRCLKIVIEGNDDFAAFSSFDGIYGSKTDIDGLGIDGM